MKKFNMILALILATQTAFAGVITDDKLELGKPSSSSDKQLIFKGPTSKTLKSSSAGALNYNGNTMSVGDGTNTTNKLFEFNKGGTNPFWKYDFATGEMQSGNATAINHGANSLSLGDGTNSNKVLKFNKGASSPEIRYNSGTGKLQFSNDTVSYKDIGSGSGGGGGTNLLQDSNSDFEAGSPPQNWTASGGTFIAETTNPLFGLASGSWDSSASAQTLSSALVTIEKGFIGKKCTADIEYKWASGVSADLSFQVVDQVPNILATVDLEPTTGSNTRKAFLAFDCPTTATDQLRVRLLSNVSNPALILIDNAFVGVNKSTVAVSQAGLIASGYFPTTASCAWSRTNTALGAMSDADCPGPTVEYNNGPGVLVGTDFDAPKFQINNLPPGRYEVFFQSHAINSGSAFSALAISDGSTLSGQSGAGWSSTATQFHALGTFTYTSAGNRTFELFVSSASGAITMDNNANNQRLYFGIRRFPLENAEALNLETTGWKVDASISGANASLSGSAQSAYIGIEDPGLTIASNPGSLPVQIPCSSTNAPTGLTCAAGNESIGVSFNVPVAGDVRACVSFSHSIQLAASGDANAIFQIVETANNAQTIIQEGKSKVNSRAAAPTTFAHFPYQLCGNFNFASAGQKTLRLMYEQGITATVSANVVLADANAALGQRDVHWEVYPVNQGMPAPVFTELRKKTNSPAEGVNLCSVSFADIDSVSFTDNTSCVSSVTDLGTIHARLNWSNGVFANGLYSCTCTTRSNSFTSGECVLGNKLGASIELQHKNSTGTLTNAAVEVTCVGK
jgi:hypothetical protein